ncbi:MAG: MG2 domain-containing protein [Bacteroidia bacterium]|nr:MG2 domain-containing protein [Bacteroidia bacterium]
MKLPRFFLPVLFAILVSSCGKTEKPPVKLALKKPKDLSEVIIPIDKGFSEYISGYTSGIISVNSQIEIRFTPELAAKANKQTPAGLFMFEPVIRGKAEWTDDVTLTFKPAKTLDPGTVYSGKLNLDRLTEVKESLKTFPIRFQTIKKDFIVTTGALESSEEGNKYSLHGQITASDYIASEEVEAYLQAKMGRKKMVVMWDHSDGLIHKFNVLDIFRSDKSQKLELSWDGAQAKVKQKGTASVNIPPSGEFSVIDLITGQGENQNIDIIFSDPVDASQETEGLIWLSPAKEMSVSINSNIVSIFQASRPEGKTELNVETSLKNKKGASLSSPFRTQLDFSPVLPAIELIGNGVILPASQNLIFPFKAANLKSVDLKIIKIFESNLPWFLQENEINTGNSIKRFGRPLYSGKVDLVNPSGKNSAGWNLYTIDLSEYIDVEPGILYRVELSMRPSYSLYPCSDAEDMKKYEEMIKLAEETNQEFWDDPENYYSESDDYIYYSFDFNWHDRNDPCKAAYFNPDRKVTRNILASNFGIVAKKGSDNNLHVIVNDLLTALPLSEVVVSVFDFQLQEIISGNTDQNGSVKLVCDRKPFLIVAKKDKDRNYLKINDGSSLSLSSFDVSGIQPEKGIKAFIYGERDVWRPGDSIYLSVFLKDMHNAIPPDHPVLFELINPMEQKVDNQMQKSGGKNLLVFKTATAPDAVTGDYKAQFRIGGAMFTKRVRVETIKPNRLKIDLNFPGEILGGSGVASKGTLKVKWLNGATAGNLKSSVEYILNPTKTEFAKYRQYNFDDPAIKFYSETSKMFEGSVDENGDADVIFNPGDEINAPGMLNAIFTAKVAEKGGDESITQAVYKYALYPVFVGVELPGLKGKERMLFTDKENKVNIVTVDPKGNPVNSEAEVTVYKISYRWWWESDQEDLAAYISNNSYKPVISKKIRTSGGEGSFSFNIGRNEWGRYLIRVSSPDGHSTGKIILVDWPYEYGMKGNTEGATLLAINTDKEKYNPGDEVRLSFPAPENSRIIVTLENSTSVLEEMRAIGTKGNTVVSFKAKPEMAPNVYAYVTVIQPHAQTINDMPMRLYGVIPVMVEDPDTRLEPEISMPDQIRSQQKFEIRVSEAKRKPMTYTVAVVDEGLLDVTGFKTPDPWKYFYAREALGVQTWDLYDMVLGAFGGTLERILAIGGDEAVIDRAANKAQRFIPVVRFLGPFTLGPGKTATHSIALPQYTGSVRTMVIAGSERAFGYAEKSVPVKDPLMILATAPRVVSPGEKVALPVTLFIQKEKISSVDLIAEGNDLVTFAEKVKTVPVSGTGEKDIDLIFTAGDRTGIAKIKLTASGGGETAVYNIELDVRSPNPPETRGELKLLKPGEKWETSFVPFGMEGSDAATLEASLLPSVNLEKRLEYLVDYPHGCTEQITSAAFPQLWLKDLTINDAKTVETASANIREAVNKIITRQMNNGGIALWPGNYQADNWVTSYAGHFMTEAERKGYSIPSDFKRKWISYQKKTSQEWRFDPKFKQSANDQAYRLFTLALAGAPERGAMNRLRESADIPQVSRWFLAAAFATAGRPEVAGDLLDMRNLQPENEYSGYYYGSLMRDKAIILYTLSILKKEEEALPLLKAICDDLNTQNWYSTQSLAWGLFSCMKFAEMVPPDNTGQAKFNVTCNGERSEQSVESKKILERNLNVKKGTNTLVVENTSGKPLYFNLVRKGVPLVSDLSVSDKGLSMKIDYMNTEIKPVDCKNLVQGTDFVMVAKVTNTTFSHVDNIALTQMVPSGWEIQNTRLFEANYGIKESAYEYRDIRDDRVNTYFSLNQGETKTFVLILNAAYKGEFWQPSIWCEAMYTENCYTRVPGNKVIVTGQ